MLVCFLAAGLYFSVRTGWFQFRRMGLWLRKTGGELVCPESGEDQDAQGKRAGISRSGLDKESRLSRSGLPKEPGLSRRGLSKGVRNSRRAQDKGAGISQRQSICTALAATVGTGNIVGVATAIVAGGPGAVFWMWISAFLGMMTGFAEKVLGILYRQRDENGRYQGGPMTYMEDGLHAKWLAVLYAFLCMVASFGVGNMAQVHSMSGSMEVAFGVPAWLTGVVTAAVLAVVLVGGIRRIGALTERLVPFMVLLYMGSALVVLVSQAEQIPAAFASIFREAFRLRPALGGAAGYGIAQIMGQGTRYSMAQAMRIGVARGTFTHEAGVGSSVFAHSAADTQEPVQQGMWGIFEVFVDTIVVCTVTALVIMTTGLAQSGVAPEHSGVIGTGDITAIMSQEGMVLDGLLLDGAPLTMRCFQQFFPWGQQLIAVCLVLFGFGSLIGWSYYGERSAEYLFGPGGVLVYKLLYVLVVTLGAVASLEVVWKLADVCNGLMAIPNLMAVFLLRKQVLNTLKEYERKGSNYENPRKK